VGCETINWSEGFASSCDKESRKRTYVSDVDVLKLLDRFGDGDSAAAGGSLYGREAIEFVDATTSVVAGVLESSSVRRDAMRR
jgi:hypothetical protein